MVPPSPEDAHDVLLADGTAARVRLLAAGDTERVRALYARSSDRARYLRFFSPVSADAAARLTAPPDDAQRCTLVAEVDGLLVAIAEYDLDETGELAEIAFMVEDAFQHRGLGTILLERLVQRAAARGVRRFRAGFLRANPQMSDVLAHAGFPIRWIDPASSTGSAEFELVPNPGWLDAHARRDDHAQARSIARLLSPRTIAVVGAGRGDDSIGHAIVANLVAGGFTGAIHPINPHPATIAGHPTVPTVLDVPGELDLAIVAVPADRVLEVARQCAQKHVDGLVVISGGFAELPGGARVQDELVALCRSSGIRLIGPNCVGVINTDEAVRMNATFSPARPEPGRVGFASQSGGVGIELLSRAHTLGLGVSTFVSMGNKADVSGNDLLQYWAEDPATDVILLYLESFGNPRKFARIARQLTRHKPVVAMKSGRTKAGARGTRSHTAALTDVDRVVDVVLRATGVVRVDTLEELFDTASLLAHQPPPAGRRVAVMSNGGGPAIIAADACVAAGLDVPELSPGLQSTLRSLAPAGAAVQNPVDLIAAASADVFEHATRALLGSDEIDALLAIYVAPYVTHASDVEAAIARAVADATATGTTGTTGTTVAACFLGVEHPPAVLATADGARGVPSFTYPESAARALARAAWLGEWRQRPSGRLPQLAHLDPERARARVADTLAAAAGDDWAPAETAFGLLTDYGIPVVRTERATSADDAVQHARAMGYPVALKANAPGLVHKADIGGVRLHLTDDAAVTAAFDDLRTAVGAQLDGVLVQPMVAPGVELIVGITHEAAFGPLVLFGMGGYAAELQRDTALGIPPLTDVDVDELLHALRSSPLLFGFRNAPPVDVAALGDLLTRVGRLAADVDEIADLDCNPVIVSPGGAVVVDAKLRLAARPPVDGFALDD